MRVKLTYEKLDGESIILPLHYNYYIQSLIYRIFSSELATKLHRDGFVFGKRKFKLFTFSRITEKGARKDGGKLLVFKNRISFYFSSPHNNIVEDLGEGAFKKREFTIFNQRIFLSQLEILTLPRIEDKVIIKMLSPVTMYSTREEGNKKNVYYYKPDEEEFQKLIEENAKKKYLLIYGKDPKNLSLSIKPYKFSIEKNHSIVFFKNNPVEGWTGIYKLSGSPELISVTYEAGLGSKNSEGFGMWEVWKGGERDA
ncbi:MAG: CRISPR-associated endoribonuclease Cas6 [bacterium]